MTSRPLRTLLMCAWMHVLTACSSGHGGAPPPTLDAGAPDVVSDLASPDAGGPTGLSIQPATVELVVTDPANPPSARLTASAIYADGSAQPVSASWTVDRLDIASVGAGNGAVTAT